MARGIKLPEELKDWKITSLVSEKKGQNKYRIVKKDSNGEVYANLFHIFAYGDNYSTEKADFFEEEVSFLNSISQNNELFTCFGAYLYDNPSKQKADMYIATEELEPLSKVMRSKDFSDDEITYFGLQMAEILSFLEDNNIFHGNIRPENIFVTADNKYKLGGFSDFECKVTDLDFSAPEVAENRNPDFTTDIYSIGLIMYCLANDKNLPFEGGLITKAEAVKMRTEGTTVTAPKNGNEKLKSIIIIAIQPKNENRWKNAVNMKNALLASCGKLPIEALKEKSENSNEPVVESVPIALNEIENSNNDLEKSADISQPENKSEQTTYEENTPEETTPLVEPAQENSTAAPISNDIFDEYEIKKAPEIEDVKTVQKDYGTFFDDIDNTKENKIENANSLDNGSEINNFDVTETQTEPTNQDAVKKPRKKGVSVAIVTISIIIILAVLGFIGYIVYEEVFSEKINNTKPASADEATTSETVTQPTTIAPTTEPTTVSSEKEILSVVGYDYESAKAKLEEQGFKVAEGNHTYSTLYSEGYVISQTPEAGTMAEADTVITLDISLGEEYSEPETSANEESSQSSATENSFIFANSDSSYISQSEVKNLNDHDLEIALNEIYAKRGWIFTDPELASYFNSQAWYNPRYTSAEFSKNVTFNEYEQANIQLMINEQKDRGIR